MVGSGIRQLRIKSNLTQQDLAKGLGVSRQAICMWEADKRELKARMLNKIAEFFKVTVDEIIQSHSITILDKKEGVKMAKTLNKTCVGVMEKEACMDKKVTLRKVIFELMAPKANKVSLTGSFNSWNPNASIMKKGKTGLWSTEIPLKSGRYEYKYVVDGQWIIDPANSKTVTNSLGSQNSIKEVA